MPALSTIVIADGQTTPVNHTFTPAGINSAGVATYEDRVSGFPVGYNVLTTSLRKPGRGDKNRNYKVQVKLLAPVTELLAGATYPTLAFEDLGNVDFVIAEKSSLANRKDILAMMRNALNHAQVTALIEGLESTW